MRIIFLLDNNEYVEVDPTKLQLRQVSPGQSALGVEVNVPLRNEDGSPQVTEEGLPLTQVAFRPFVNYPVDLSVPKPEEAPTETPAPALVAGK